MELYKKSYKGIFIGRNKKNWKITRHTIEDALDEILDYISEDDEGIIEIHETDINTNKRNIIRTIILVNELNLFPQPDVPQDY